MKQQNIVIFASGTGTNAAKLMTYFRSNSLINVVALITNNANSGAISHAKENNIHTFIYENETFIKGNTLALKLSELNTNYIILAGFLRMIPKNIVQSFEDRIINIHPSLLPKYGGKGMYGTNVHRAVIENKEKESGITIHLVDEVFDRGRKIAQFYVMLNSNETILSLKNKIQQLEHHYFAPTIEQYIKLKES